MKKFILINLILLTCILASDLKDKSINEIKSFYNKEVKISNRIKFSIPKNLKNSIQAETNQKFYLLTSQPAT